MSIVNFLTEMKMQLFNDQTFTSLKYIVFADDEGTHSQSVEEFIFVISMLFWHTGM